MSRSCDRREVLALAGGALLGGVVGGYGGHMTLAVNGGRKVTSIDFNSTAPKAARDDMFPLDGQGQVKGAVNLYGWLAAGVPGTLAGLQLALDRYGSRPFAVAVK